MSMNMNDNSNNKADIIRSRIERVAGVFLAASVIALGTPSGPALAEELPPGELHGLTAGRK